MRFSLIILACLATAFGANLEETTDVPTTSLNVEDGKVPTPIDLAQDEGIENESFEDSEIMGEDEGLDLPDEDKHEGDEEDSDDPKTYPAEDKTAFESEKSDGTDGDAEGTTPNDSVGDAVPPNPDEDEINEDGNDALPTTEIDFEGSDSDSEVGNEPSDEYFAGDGDKSQGSTELQISEDEKQDQSDEHADGEGSDGSDGVPDIQEDNVENSEEDIDEKWDENFDSEGKDEEISFDQAQDVDETFPSPATEDAGSDEIAPKPAPTFSPTPYPMPFKSPTLRPAVPYVSSDDDPLENSDGYASKIEDWFSNESTIEEMEHDKTVIIALSVVFGLMFFFSVFVAYQMLENPDGCCARLVFMNQCD